MAGAWDALDRTYGRRHGRRDEDKTPRARDGDTAVEHVYDGDTTRERDGTDIRLEGADAPETPKRFDDGRIELGEPGGAEATEVLKRRLEGVGPAQRTGARTYNREVGRYEDPDGGSVGEYLIGVGAAAPMRGFSDQGDIDAEKRYGLRRRGVGAFIDDPEAVADAQRMRNARENRASFKHFDRYASPAAYGGRDTAASASLERGTDQMQASLYAAANAIGEVTGFDPIAEWGMEGFQRNLEEVLMNPPQTAGIEDVDNFSDGATYITERLFEAFPGMAAMLAPGGAGAGAARYTVGRALMKRALDAKLKQEARRRATQAGATAGMAAGSYPQQVGEMQGEFIEEGIDAPDTALVAGVPRAVLDAVGVERVISRMMPDVPLETAKDLVMEVGKNLGFGSAVEAGTETLQELIGITARAYEDPNYEILGEESQRRLANAAVAGATVGGTLAGGGTAVTGGVSYAANRGAQAGPERQAGRIGPAPAGGPATDAVNNAAGAAPDAPDDELGPAPSDVEAEDDAIRREFEGTAARHREAADVIYDATGRDRRPPPEDLDAQAHVAPTTGRATDEFALLDQVRGVRTSGRVPTPEGAPEPARTAEPAQPATVPEPTAVITRDIAAIGQGERRAAFVEQPAPGTAEALEGQGYVTLPTEGAQLVVTRPEFEAEVRRLIREDRLGEALGYGVSRKPEDPADPTVVSVRNDADEPTGHNVVVDRADEPEYARAREAAERLGQDLGGRVEERPAEDVLRERLNAVRRERAAAPPSEPVADRVPATEPAAGPVDTPSEPPPQTPAPEPPTAPEPSRADRLRAQYAPRTRPRETVADMLSANRASATPPTPEPREPVRAEPAKAPPARPTRDATPPPVDQDVLRGAIQKMAALRQGAEAEGRELSSTELLDALSTEERDAVHAQALAEGYTDDTALQETDESRELPDVEDEEAIDDGTRSVNPSLQEGMTEVEPRRVLHLARKGKAGSAEPWMEDRDTPDAVRSRGGEHLDPRVHNWDRPDGSIQKRKAALEAAHPRSDFRVRQVGERQYVIEETLPPDTDAHELAIRRQVDKTLHDTQQAKAFNLPLRAEDGRTLYANAMSITQLGGMLAGYDAATLGGGLATVRNHFLEGLAYLMDTRNLRLGPAGIHPRHPVYRTKQGVTYTFGDVTRASGELDRVSRAYELAETAQNGLREAEEAIAELERRIRQARHQIRRRDDQRQRAATRAREARDARRSNAAGEVARRRAAQIKALRDDVTAAQEALTRAKKERRQVTDRYWRARFNEDVPTDRDGDPLWGKVHRAIRDDVTRLRTSLKELGLAVANDAPERVDTMDPTRGEVERMTAQAPEATPKRNVAGEHEGDDPLPQQGPLSEEDQAKVRVSYEGRDPTLSELRTFAERIFAELGIPARARIVDEAGLEALLKERPQSKVLRSTLDDGYQGRIIYSEKIDGQPIIFIKTRNLKRDDPSRAWVLMHELGHMVQFEVFNSLPERVQQAVRDEVGGATEHNFRERFADQFGAWIESRTRPRTLAEVVFARVQSALRRLWQMLRNKAPERPKYSAFLDALHAQAQGLSALDADARRNLDTEYGRTVLEAVRDTLPHAQRVNPIDSDFTLPKWASQGKMGRLIRRSESAVREAFGVWERTGGVLVRTQDGWLRRQNAPVLTWIADHWRRPAGQTTGERETTHPPIKTELRRTLGPYRVRITDIVNRIRDGRTKQEAQAHEDRVVDALMDERLDTATLRQMGLEEAAQVRELFDDLYGYLKASGVPIRRRKNYFPFIVDKQLWSQNEDRIVAILEEAGYSRVEAAETWERIAHAEDALFDLNLVDEAGRDDPSGPGFRYAMPRRLPQAVRHQLKPYLVRDLTGILLNYTVGAGKLGVHARRFGGAPKSAAGRPDLRKWDPLYTVKNRLERAFKEGEITAEQYARVKHKILPAFMGQLGADQLSPEVRRLMSAAYVYQNVRLLPLALLSNFVDTGTLIHRAGVGPATRAFRQAANKRSRQQLLDQARLLGIIEDRVTDHVMNDQIMAQHMSPKMQRFNERFFRWNGMQQYTNLMRVSAFAAGKEFLQDHAAKAKRGDATSRRWLDELGTDADAVQAWFRDGEPLDAESSVPAALDRFVDQSVMRPDSSMRPTWGSDHRAMLLWHLKGFMWTFHKEVLERVANEIKHRRGINKLVPPLMLGLALLPFAALGYELRRFLTMKGSGNPHVPQFGSLDYLWEISQRAGVLGIFQTMVDAKQAADYDQLVLFSLMGPTATQVSEYWTKDFDTFLERATPLVSQNVLGSKDFVRGIW